MSGNNYASSQSGARDVVNINQKQIPVVIVRVCGGLGGEERARNHGQEALMLPFPLLSTFSGVSLQMPD